VLALRAAGRWFAMIEHIRAKKLDFSIQAAAARDGDVGGRR
jgi:hypothetical protein